MRLSVLDLLMVRTGQSTADAVRAAHTLARQADRLGYTRYWVAEHHNMPAVASTVPAVLIAHLATGTEQIRFGSGGVMVPNHTAITIAEQFALLEAMLPGRIDLGLGRAPGADAVTSHLVRGGRPDAAGAFDQDVLLIEHLLGLHGPGPTTVTLGGHPVEVRASPLAVSSPQVWLLGSSDYSARLAAARGLPYVFANHFGMPGVDDAVALYRREFRPTDANPLPRTILTVGALVHPDPHVADTLAQPQLVHAALLRTGERTAALRTVEDALAHPWTAQQRAVADRMREQYLIGTPETVVTRLRAMAAALDVDEVMVAPLWGAYAEEDPSTPGNRAITLDLLAREILDR